MHPKAILVVYDQEEFADYAGEFGGCSNLVEITRVTAQSLKA